MICFYAALNHDIFILIWVLSLSLNLSFSFVFFVPLKTAVFINIVVLSFCNHHLLYFQLSINKVITAKTKGKKKNHFLKKINKIFRTMCSSNDEYTMCTNEVFPIGNTERKLNGTMCLSKKSQKIFSGIVIWDGRCDR